MNQKAIENLFLSINANFYLIYQEIGGRRMPKNVFQCRICGVFTEEPRHCGTKGIFLFDGAKRKRLSKLMSLILRHDPSRFDVILSPEGYTPISELVARIRLYTDLTWVTETHIRAIAALDPKGRFEIKDNLIRARYGHSASLNIHLQYEEIPTTELPNALYHGTLESNLSSILTKGLIPMQRKFVHLTTSKKDAVQVAFRHRRGHERVLLLKIDPLKLLSAGQKIYRASDKIFLVEYVPPDAIVVE